LGLILLLDRTLRFQELQRVDPPTLISVVLAVLATSLVAGDLPARRAARIHPMEARRD
jgi:ABC-type lipoprotein release transport system permease subunit